MKLIVAVLVAWGVIVAPAALGSSEALLGSESCQDGSSDCSNFDYSDNFSIIRMEERNSIAQAPKDFEPGTKYNSDRSQGYESTISRQTWIANTRTGTSMHREVGYAQSLEGGFSLEAADRTYRQGDQVSTDFGYVQMSIDESVTEGRVSIGVLQAGNQGDANSSTAWKDPMIEMEQDYVGTYHIETNMSLGVPTSLRQAEEDWLTCCSGGYFDISEGMRKYLSAERVFDCTCGDYLRQRAALGLAP